MVNILDLHFKDANIIASFLYETSEGPILIECGPHSTIENLKIKLRAFGYELGDIKYLFLTHIHFDHAGAAWALAEKGTKIFVHPKGLPHLQDPERLYNSAKRIYGDEMENLWGIMKPIPSKLLNAVTDKEVVKIGEIDLKAYYTPGHAAHHIAWKINDIIFTGDVAGCRIHSGPVVPPCPPPDINIAEWKKSIETIRESRPKTMYLTHFGKVTNIGQHLNELSSMLDQWSTFIKELFEIEEHPEHMIPKFEDYIKQQFVQKKVSLEDIDLYNIANPPWQSVYGLYRYWKKRTIGEL